MGSISLFDGKGDMVGWSTQVRSKLISKGFKNVLLDANKILLQTPEEQAAWEVSADKATGVILTYLDPDVASQFEHVTTPQTLLEALKLRYKPDEKQEIERLEREFTDLTYDGSDPVAWVAGVRALIAKLTTRQAAPTERTIRTLVLRAIEKEPEYKIRVEIIRQTNPDIPLIDLWTAIGRLPYPLEKKDSKKDFAFTAFNQWLTSHNRNDEMSHHGRGNNRGQSTGSRGRSPVAGRGRGGYQAPSGRGGGYQDRSRYYDDRRDEYYEEGHGRGGNNDNSSSHAPPATSRTLRLMDQRTKDIYEGNCFRCHKPGHVTMECDLPFKRDAQELKDRGGALKRVTREENEMKKTAPVSMDSVSTTPVNTTPVSAFKDIALANPLPAVLPPQWDKENKMSESVDLEVWWSLEQFPHNPKVEMGNLVSTKWDALRAPPIPPTNIEVTEIGIAGDSNSSVIMYNAKEKFGLLTLEGGKIYFVSELGGMVLAKLDTLLATQMVKCEKKLDELTNQYGEIAAVWIIWRETVLYRLLGRKLLREYYEKGDLCVKIKEWASFAGVNVKGERIQERSIVEFGRQWYYSHQTPVLNYMHALPEMLKYTCKCLLKKHGSFAWLADKNLKELTGISAKKMLGRQRATMETVVTELTFQLLYRKGTVTLMEVHNAMLKLKVPTVDVELGGFFGGECKSNNIVQCNNTTLQICEERNASSGVDVGKNEKIFIDDNDKVFNLNDFWNKTKNFCNKNEHEFDEIVKLDVDRYENYTKQAGIALVSLASTQKESVEPKWYVSEVDKALKAGNLGECWIADSGATKHMTSHAEWISELRPVNTGVKVGGGQVMPCDGVGKISLTMRKLDGSTTDITLNDVLLVPDLFVNLFSITRAAVHGDATIVTDKKFVQLKLDGVNSETIGIGRYTPGQQLFVLDCDVNVPDVEGDSCLIAQSKGSSQYNELMHKRLVHVSASKMKILHLCADGVKKMSDAKPHECTVCAEMKSKRKAIPKEPIPRAEKPLYRIYVDLIGPFPRSVRGYLYGAIMSDSNTRRRWTRKLKHKGESQPELDEWADEVEAKSGHKIKYIRCDNGGEFDNEAIRKWAAKRGYTFERTAPYTPSQNGVAERYNLTLMDSVRAVMRHFNIPKDWWDFAFDHCNKVWNMLPCKKLGDKSPDFMWTGKVPDLSRLRVFGCLAYAHLDGRKLPKLTARAVPCVYLGHAAEGDGWLLWNWLTDKVITCRSVDFFEGCSAFSIPEAKAWMKNVKEDLLWEIANSSSEEEVVVEHSSIESESVGPIPVVVTNARRAPVVVGQNNNSQAQSASSSGLSSGQAAPIVVSGSSSSNQVSTNSGTGAGSSRVHFGGQSSTGAQSTSAGTGGVGGGGSNSPPHNQQNSASSSSSDTDSSSSTSTLKSKRKTRKKKRSQLSPVFKGQDAPSANINKTGPAINKTVLRSSNSNNNNNAKGLIAEEVEFDLSIADEMCLIATLTQQLPAEIEKFKQAMLDEVQALEDMAVYEEKDVKPGTHVIGVKWVLKEKKATSLSPAKLKARLVARGFTQTYGVNYEETHAPVARTASMRTVLAVCAAKGWKVHQIDVNNAYLNGEIDMEGIYIKQPPYFVNLDHPKRVWLLLKGLYGLKQAAKIWFKTFVKHLVEDVKLIAHNSEPCLFTSVDDEGNINSISSIYVDDGLIGGPDEVIQWIKGEIAKRFPIKDLGEAKHVVGMQVEQLPEGTLLTQGAYVDEILEMAGLQDCHPLSLPMKTHDSSYTVAKDEGGNYDEAKQVECTPLNKEEHQTYRQYVGKLMYLMVCTRPDIAFAVNFLARSCAAPERRHMDSVKNLIRYLKGTRLKGLFYAGKQDGVSPEFDLIGYVDAAFGDCLETRKSTGGYLFCLNGAPITWQSRRQSIVTTSSTEAEYVAACAGAKEAIWLRQLLEDMGCVPAGPTVLYEDNDSCRAQTENPLHHKRTKHIDIAYHFTRQMVEEGIVKLQRIDTGEQVADMMTKPLCKALFKKHFDALGMRAAQIVVKK